MKGLKLNHHYGATQWGGVFFGALFFFFGARFFLWVAGVG